jgi:peptidoglycan/LPS O-acetylase OafA/YrhL
MSKTERRLTYLPDIDGLRAMAVLAVVLFHLKISGFDGGYVGVDIFFVISGFLISGLIRDRVETDSFSFSDFYARRVSRLLPAVLATVGATAIASVFILQPEAFGSFALSAAASVFSTANFVFYLESSYWDASAELKPLLHLWSLGVEEQFYLFWPALIVFLTNSHPNIYRWGLMTVFFSSLSICIWYTGFDSAASFYLLPFRVWQFALGALVLEAWRHHSLSELSRQLLRSLGLALCGISIVTFSEATPFPGWHALFPSVGAALVLASAHEASGSIWLSNPLARRLGQLSYSMYLVHWPPIVLYRHYSVTDLTPEVKASLGVLTVALTLILHYGVEQKFYRRGYHFKPQWRGLAGYILSSSLVLAVVLLVMSQNTDRVISRKALLPAEIVQDYKSRRFKLTKNACGIQELGATKRCSIPDVPAVLFLGNSHEVDGYNIVTSALAGDPHRPLIVFGSINNCRTLTIERNWVRSSDSACQLRFSALLNSLHDVKWHTVIYSARRPYAENKEPLITVLETIHAQQPNVHIVVIEDYLSTKRECASLINKFESTRACATIDHLSGLPGVIEESRPFQERAWAITNSKLDKVALLCGGKLPESCPAQTPQGHPMSMDEHHLTLEFAQWVGEQLAEINPPWLQALRYSPEDTPSRK